MGIELKPTPKEDSTYYISGIFDDKGVPVPASDIATLQFWLHDASTGAIINGRNGVNALNTGPGTVDESGNFELTLDPDDNPILGDVSVGGYEKHVLTIEWTWNGGLKKSHETIDLFVKNSPHVPTA